MQNFPLLYKLLVFAFLLFAQLVGYSQQRCGTVAEPNMKFENWVKEKTRFSRTRFRTSDLPVLKVPIVVHVFHKGESIGEGFNIPESRIVQQIESLNKDFRRLNDDRVNTPEIFQDVAADIHIEFVLAKQDPDGNPTNGVVRLEGNNSSYGISSRSLNFIRQESYWPPEHYLNIYCIDLNGFLGYANFPTSEILSDLSNTSLPLDGALVDTEYFGVNPDAAQFSSIGRTLTHEIGHYLGLYHIWGSNGCGNDDFVEDTPLADTDHSLLDTPCTFPTEEPTCSDEAEMFQNYMDYTNDICMNLFTSGQRTRMRIILENSFNRKSLLTSPALIDPIGLFKTDMSIMSVDAPLVTNDITPEISLSVLNRGKNEINSSILNITVNEDSKNESFGFENFTSGLFTSVVTSQRLSQGFNKILFDITNVNDTLDGSNFQSNAETFIYLDQTSNDLPLRVDFETPNDWILTSRTDTLWQEVFFGDSSLIKANGYAGESGNQSWFISPTLNTNEIDHLTLSFQVSYGNRINLNDSLKILLSDNGGNSYAEITGYSADSLAYELSEDQWRPHPDKWKSFTLNLPDSIISSNDIRLAFVFENAGGNDLFIDNINLSNYAPVFEGAIKIFPNPISGSSINIGFNAIEKQAIQIQIINASGAIINKYSFDNALNQLIQVKAPKQSGLYFVRIIGEDFTQIERIIIRR